MRNVGGVAQRLLRLEGPCALGEGAERSKAGGGVARLPCPTPWQVRTATIDPGSAGSGLRGQSQARRSVDAARGSAGAAATPFRADHRLEARPGSGGEPARSRFQRQRPESEVGCRHYLRQHCRRLAFPRAGDGSVQPPSGGLGNVRAHRRTTDRERPGACAGAAQPARRSAASLRPRQSVLRSQLPQSARRSSHHGLDEPTGELLRQRGDGVGQRHAEGRTGL